MAPDDSGVLGEVNDPDGQRVVLLARIWEDKIARDHPELGGELDEVLATVGSPDHREPAARTDPRRWKP